MAGSTFQTNPIDLNRLLDECHRGVIQLPDFQRSWVWDEDRIKSLIASISRAFPVGALMSLDTGGPVNFKPRPIEGAPATARQTLDVYLKSHLADPALLRADKFAAFMDNRQKQLLALIEQAMGKAAYTGSLAEEGEDAEADEDTTEADLTIAAA